MVGTVDTPVPPCAISVITVPDVITPVVVTVTCPYVPALAPDVGKSVATNARNVGWVAVPVVGPANTVLAVCVLSVNVNVPVVVTGEPLIEYIEVVDASFNATLVTPVLLIVTAPVAPDTLIPVPATADVTPVLLICNVPEPVVVLIPVPVVIVKGTYVLDKVPTRTCPDVGCVVVPVPPKFVELVKLS